MEKDRRKQKKKIKPLIAFTVGRKPKEEGTENDGGGKISQLGREERKMMLSVTGPQPPLDYPMHLLQMSDGTFTQEYEIPEEEREAVFRKLYLFENPPAMDETILDIHENKRFKASEFRVIREGEGNFIVSPFYPISGGTLLDWVSNGDVKQDDDVVVTAHRFRQEPPKEEEPPMDTNGPGAVKPQPKH